MNTDIIKKTSAKQSKYLLCLHLFLFVLCITLKSQNNTCITSGGVWFPPIVINGSFSPTDPVKNIDYGSTWSSDRIVELGTVINLSYTINYSGCGDQIAIDQYVYWCIKVNSGNEDGSEFRYLGQGNSYTLTLNQAFVIAMNIANMDFSIVAIYVSPEWTSGLRNNLKLGSLLGTISDYTYPIPAAGISYSELGPIKIKFDQLSDHETKVLCLHENLKLYTSPAIDATWKYSNTSGDFVPFPGLTAYGKTLNLDSAYIRSLFPNLLKNTDAKGNHYTFAVKAFIGQIALESAPYTIHEVVKPSFNIKRCYDNGGIGYKLESSDIDPPYAVFYEKNGTPISGSPIKQWNTVFYTSKVVTQVSTVPYIQTTAVNECASALDSNQFGPLKPITMTLSSENVSCKGLNTGTITINSTYPFTPTYEYKIDTAKEYNNCGSKITALSKNNYNVRTGTYSYPNNAFVCSTSQNVLIAAIRPNLTITSVPVGCPDFRAKLNATNCNPGAIKSLYYRYNDNFSLEDSSDFPSLEYSLSNAYYYKFAVKDAYDCMSPKVGFFATGESDIPGRNNMLIYNLLHVNESCSGKKDGSISGTVRMGSGSIKIVLIKGTSRIDSVEYPNTASTVNLIAQNFSFPNKTLKSIDSGSYTIEATDIFGKCVNATEPISVGRNGIPVIDIPIVTPAGCSGMTKPNGGITVTATPKNGTVCTYSLSGPSTPPSNNTGVFSNLKDGSYTITVTDSESCSSTKTQVIGVVGNPIINNTSIEKAACSSANDGKIFVNATFKNGTSGGAKYELYKLNEKQTDTTSPVFTQLATGTYKVKAIDSVGCSTTSDDIVLGSYSPKVSISFKNQYSNCQDVLEAKVSDNKTNNNIVFKLNDAIEHTVSDIIDTFKVSNGTYWVSIKDSAGCTATSETKILSLKIPLITYSTGYDSCFGQIHVTASNTNAAPYIYTCRENDCSKCDYSYSTSNSLTQTFFHKKGNYYIKVVDGYGCNDSTYTSLIIQSPTFSEPPELEFTKCTTNIVVQAQFHTGQPCLIYLLNSSNSIVDSLTDDLKPENLKYFLNIPSGNNYKVKLKDAYGCSNEFDSIDNDYTPPKITLTKDYVNCMGALYAGFATYKSAVFTATCTSSGSTYPKHNSSTPILYKYYSLPPGKTYNVSITDKDGCTRDSNMFINSLKESPSVTASITKYDSCKGEITVIPVFNNSPAGNINLYKINSPTDSTLILTRNNIASENSIKLPLQPGGLYNVTVEDTAGCKNSTRVSVNIKNPAVSTNFTYSKCKTNICLTASNCNSSLKTFYLSENTSYPKHDSTGGPTSLNTCTFNGFTSGNYIVEVIDAIGCISPAVQVKINPLSSPSFSTNYPSPLYKDCSVTLKVKASFPNPNDTIQIYKYGQTTPLFKTESALSNTTYSYDSIENKDFRVRLADSYGCFAETTSLKYNVDKTGTIFTEGPTVTYQTNCRGTVTFKGNFANSSGIYNKVFLRSISGTIVDSIDYAQSNVTYSLDSIIPGEYDLILKDAAGCTKTQKVNIALTKPELIAPYDYASCMGRINASVTKLNSSSCIFSLDIPANADNPDFTEIRTDAKCTFDSLITQSGYVVIVKDMYGCGDTSLVDIDGIYSGPTMTGPVVNYYGCDRRIIVKPTFLNLGPDQCAIHLYKNNASVPDTSVLNAKSNVEYTLGNRTNGTYKVVLLDGKGCSLTSSQKTLNYDKPVLTINNGYSDCKGVMAPSVVVANNSLPNIYQLIKFPSDNLKNDTTKNTSVTWNGLEDGNYTVNVTDGYNCTVSNSVIIAPLAASPSFITDLSYYENCSGTYKVRANFRNTNQGPCSIKLTVGDNDYTTIPNALSNTDYYVYNIPNNPFGKPYIIKLTDGAGCTRSSTAIVDVKPYPSLNSPTNIYSNCTRNISIISKINNPGTDTLRLLTMPQESVAATLLKNTSGTDTFKNISNGSYKIRITDAAGCSTSINTDIVDYTNPIISTVLGYESCAGEIIINANVYDTTKKNTYTIIEGLNTSTHESDLTTDTFKLLPRDKTYTVKLKDAYGCEVSTIREIPALLDKPVFTAGYPKLLYENCGGTIKVKANYFNPISGSSKIHLYWRGDDYHLTIENVANNQEYAFTGRDTGWYVVRLEDAAGCVKDVQKGDTIRVWIDDYSLDSAKIIPYANCLGGISVFAKTGNPGNKTFYLIGPDILEASTANNIYTFKNIHCDTLKNYHVKVIDSYGCPDTLSYSLTLKTKEDPLIDYINPGYEGCKGTIDVKAVFNNEANNNLYKRKAFLFNAIDNSAVPGFDTIIPFQIARYTGLANGNYYVKIFDGYGCQVKSSTVSLAISSKPAFSSLPVPQIENCRNSLSVNPVFYNGTSNNRIYLFSATSTPAVDSMRYDQGHGYKFSGLKKGNYKVKLVDRYGCSDSVSNISIDTVIAPLIQVNPSYTNCKGQLNATVTFSNNESPRYAYLLNSITSLTPLNTMDMGAGTTCNFPNLPGGTYWIKIHDGLGCEVLSKENYIKIGVQPQILSGYPKLSYNSGIPEITVKANIKNSGISVFKLFNSNSGTFQRNSTDSISYFTSTDSSVFNPVRQYSWAMVRDTLGCESSIHEAPSLDLTAAPEIQNYTSTNVKCYGERTGSIIVNSKATTGSGLKTYLLYKFSGTEYILNKLITPLSNNNTCSFDSLFAGNYKIEVKDYRGSSAAQNNITIDEPALPLNFSSTSGLLNCNGDANSSINVNAFGGTMPYLYRMNGGQYVSGNVFSSLGAGTYYIDVKDNNGCTASGLITVNDPAKLVITSANVKTDAYGHALRCSNTNDGKGIATAIGGTEPYSFKWFFNSEEINRDSLHAGINTVQVTDKNGCIAIGSVKIDGALVPDALGITLTPKVYSNGYNQSCYQKGDGEITAVVSGGTLPYAYYWNGPNNYFSPDATIENLREGLYVVEVYDAKNCFVSAMHTITNPSLFYISLNQHNDPDCSGYSTGSITIGVTNGLPPYSYVLENQSSTKEDNSYSFENLKAGEWFGYVQDALGCSQSFSDTLIDKTDISAGFFPKNVLCNGDQDGRITLVIYSGPGDTSKYTYEWRKSGNPDIISSAKNLENAGAGRYNVSIYNEEGCAKTFPDVEILQPERLRITSINTGNAGCSDASDGFLTFNATGGTTGNYIYSADNGNSFFNSGYFAGLTQGFYKIKVRDANNCIDSSSASIGFNVIETVIDSIGEVTCTGRKDAYLAFHGKGSSTNAYKYTIDGYVYSTVNEFKVGAGTYHILTRDTISGCTSNEQVQTVAEKDPVVVNAILIDSSACKKPLGQVDAIISGGSGKYYIKWYRLGNQMSMPTTSNLYTGTYRVFVTDELSSTCSTSDTIIVPDRPSPQITGFTINSYPWCGNATGSVKVNISGGSPAYTFIWDDAENQNSQIAINLTSRTYNVNVTDRYGCITKDSFSLPEGNFTKNTIITKANCGQSNGAVAFAINGGFRPYKFDWNGNISTDTFYNNLPAGLYNVRLIDNIGCESDINFVIGNADGPVIKSLSKIKAYCGLNTGQTTVTTSGGIAPYQYSWYDLNENKLISTSQQANNLKNGLYRITITDSKNCIADSTFILEDSVELEPIVNIYVLDSSTCDKNNGKIEAVVNGGLSPYSYNWPGFGNNNQVTGLHSGKYTVNITDSRGCEKTASILLIDKALFTFSNLKQTLSACNKPLGSVTVGTSGSNAPYNCFVNGSTSGIPMTLDDGHYKTTLSNLYAGTYNIVAIDGFGCLSDTLAVEITDDEPMQINLISKKDVTCAGFANGEAEIQVIHGLPPYSYKWNNSITSSGLFDKLKSGTNTVTVTDDNYCSVSKDIDIGSPSQLFINNIVVTNPMCNAYATGRISLNAGGGTGQYKYNWSTGSTENSISNILAGIYHVKITDNNSCTLDSDITVSEPSALEISISTVQPSCIGKTDGSIKIQPVGGTPSYICRWITSSGSVLPERINFAAGNYTADVYDKNGCHSTKAITLNNPVPVKYTLLEKKEPSCYGSANGLIVIAGEGGAKPYKIWWNSVEGTDSLKNAQAGKYFVRINDSHNCGFGDSIELQQPEPLDVNPVIVSELKCFNSTNGIIAANISGGISPYNILWNNNPGVDTAKNLSHGLYNLKVSDKNNCLISEMIALNAPSPVTASEVIKTDPTCYGLSNGAVTAKVSGGKAPFLFSLDTLTNATGIFEDLKANNYSLVISDADNCSSSPVVVNLLNPDTMELHALYTKPRCFNTETGSIAVNVNHGKPPYSYYWTETGGTLSLATNLKTGKYNVTVTDANNCIIHKNFYLDNPDSLFINNLNIIQPTCFGLSNGSINATATGGSLPYSFRYKNSSGLYISNTDNLKTGKYFVEVTDANSCTSSKEAIVSSPSEIKIITSKIKDPTCHDEINGIIDVFAQGGPGTKYSYILKNAFTEDTVAVEDSLAFGDHFSNLSLAKGSYNLSVSSNNCSSDISYELNNPSPIALSNQIIKQPSCYGYSDGSISLFSPENYLYKWNGVEGNSVIANIPAGSYSCTVRNLDDCEAVYNYTVNQPDSLAVTITPINPKCFSYSDGSISISASNGKKPYHYEWADNLSYVLPYRNNLSPGTYNIRVHYGEYCYKDVVTELKQPEKLHLNIADKSNPKCYGSFDGLVSLSISGGKPDYLTTIKNIKTQEDPGGFSGLKAGDYEISAKDFNGCNTDIVIELINPPKLGAKLITENPKCYGETNGKITITASGGTGNYRYLFNNVLLGNTLVENLSAGTYFTEIQDANNCSYIDSVTLIEPLKLSYLPELKNPDCYGYSNGSVKLDISGGNSPYVYKLGGKTTNSWIYNLSSGIYPFEIIDKKNCILKDTISLVQPDSIIISEQTLMNPKCYNSRDGKFLANITGGSQPLSYRWSSENGLVYNSGDSLPAGNYTLSITDNNKCKLSLGNVLVNPVKLSMSVQISDPKCFGKTDGLIRVNASGGTREYLYSLNSNAAEANNVNLSAGNYNIEVIDANGCTVKEARILKDPAELLIDTIIVKKPACYGYANGSLKINSSGGTGTIKYRLDGQDGIKIFTGLESKDYFVQVIDANNCIASENVSLTQPEKLKFKTLNIKELSCYNSSDAGIIPEAQGGTIPYKYNLTTNKGITLNSFTGLKAGKYAVTVTDSMNCTTCEYKTIENPFPVKTGIQIQMPTCFGDNDGKVFSSVSGGTGTYTYFWNNSQGQTYITNFLSGNYKLKVFDGNGCADSAIIHLPDPLPVVFSLVKSNPSCFGSSDGSINVSASGGRGKLKYYLDNVEDDHIFTGLAKGVFNISVKDTNNCSAESTEVLTQPDSISFTDLTYSNPTCDYKNDGIVNVSTFGGTGLVKYKYLYNDSSVITFSDSLKAGNFIIEAVDEHGCKNTKSLTMVSPPAIEASLIKNLPSCSGMNDGSISVNASGGTGNLEILLNGVSNATKLNDIGKGSYPLVITDDNNCIYNEIIDLAEPEPISINNIQLTNPKCFNSFDGIINFGISGGNGIFTCKLDNNIISPPYINLNGGNYTISVIDQKNCTAEKKVSLTQPDSLWITVDKINNASCPNSSNGSFIITAHGQNIPFIYSYFDSDSNVLSKPRSLKTGVYIAKVIDAAGCSVTKNVAITNPGGLYLSSVDYIQPSCYGYKNGSIKVYPAGGTIPYYYTWDNKSPAFMRSNLTAGNYSITVMDNSGCSINEILKLNSPELLTISSATTSNPLCYKGSDGSIDVSPAGGTIPYSFKWSNGGLTKKLTSLGAGKYDLTLSDANNCLAKASYSLSDPKKIIGAGLPESETVCPGVKYTLEPESQWTSCNWKSDNGFTSNKNKIEISKPGKYFLTAYNSNNCMTSDTFQLNNNSDLMNALFLMSAESKAGDTVIIIEVSQPVPDKIEWIFPNDAKRISSDYSTEDVAFTKEGLNAVTLIAYLGSCTDTLTKDILILPGLQEKSAYEKDSTGISPLGKFDLAPNPCKDYFNAAIILKDEKPVMIMITDISGVVVSKFKIQGLKQYNIRIDVSGLKSGLYIVNLVSKNIFEQRSIIIK